ncbi:MAG: AAA family ATPase [Puniceicoccales bacterium]|jgi:endopeptidase Clp ATP-binding regulatory subunit ClpX|nr:AAA family ATPase [Puniceicoccales bacterium]
MKTLDEEDKEQPSDTQVLKGIKLQGIKESGEKIPPGEKNVNLLKKIREQVAGLFFGFSESGPFPSSGGVFEPKNANRKPKKDTSPEKENADRVALEKIFSFSMKPRDIFDYLERFVIQQKEAKKVLSVAICDHYNHVRRCIGHPEERKLDYGKPNVLLLGPTGVGKTYLIRHVARLLGVPFVKADATKFSETGYVGNDVEDLVRNLVRTADGNVELARYGIIFVDEIDKIASLGEGGRDVSGRGVQINLLKLMEDTDVNLVAPNDITAQMSRMLHFGDEKPRKETIATKHILFIVSGAFEKLNDHIRRRTAASAIGFGNQGNDGRDSDFLHLATTADFIQFGLEPEFIGRLPIRVACEQLHREDLAQILTASEGSILHQHARDFEGYGISLRVTAGAIDAIAVLAAEEKTGARGLMTVLERLFRNFKFHLPSMAVSELCVTEEVVRKPEEALRRLIGGQND